MNERTPGLRVDAREVTELLRALVAIPSENPDLIPESEGEGRVAEFVADYSRSLGSDVEVALEEVSPGRVNVLSTIRAGAASSESRKTLLFDAHMDTQALAPMGARALMGEIKEGYLFGRGACDDKGSLAAMLYMLKLLLPYRDLLKADVTVMASVGEEHLMNGIKGFTKRALVESKRIAAAVVGEPTDLKVVIAHKGYLRFTLTTHGVAAHSSNPEKGDSAIHQMAEVIRWVRDELPDFWSSQTHPILGSPTISIGKIWGGNAVNVVPDRCVIEIDRRVLPNEDLDSIRADVARGIKDLMARDRSLKVSFKPEYPDDSGLDTPPDSPIVITALAALRTAGLPESYLSPIGVRYGTNASTLWGMGKIPSIVLGPGSILQAHTDNEFISLDELALAPRVYAELALDFKP